MSEKDLLGLWLELREQIRKNAISFLDLRKEKEERFKHLSEASIGDESRKIAFENMHFMEDKQWIHKDAVWGLLEKFGSSLQQYQSQLQDLFHDHTCKTCPIYLESGCPLEQKLLELGVGVKEE